jgi:hypothetical protein
MVWVKNVDMKPAYICSECGFGYADARLALLCEDFCNEHKSPSPEITKKAVMNP